MKRALTTPLVSARLFFGEPERAHERWRDIDLAFGLTCRVGGTYEEEDRKREAGNAERIDEG